MILSLLTLAAEIGGVALVLAVSRDRLDTDRLRDWTRDHIIGRVPGA